jgi:hypothetical protein
MRDAVLEGPTQEEVEALTRIADFGVPVPPHLTLSLLAKGWVLIAPDGTALLTLSGRVLVDRASSLDIEQLAGVPPRLALWRPGQFA